MGHLNPIRYQTAYLLQLDSYRSPSTQHGDKSQEMLRSYSTLQYLKMNANFILDKTSLAGLQIKTMYS